MIIWMSRFYSIERWSSSYICNIDSVGDCQIEENDAVAPLANLDDMWPCGGKSGLCCQLDQFVWSSSDNHLQIELNNKKKKKKKRKPSFQWVSTG